MNIKGKFKLITPTVTGNKKDGNTWHKCELVIDTFENPKYPKLAVFEVFGEEKIKVLQDLKPGQEVDVFFNIEGSEYNGKYYSKLSFWKIDKNGNGITNESKEKKTESTNDESDNLPF